MNRRDVIVALAALAAAGAAGPAAATNRDVIETRVRMALQELYRSQPDAQQLASRARAILVMPHVVKGGFILGGSYGEGALLMDGATAGYYSVAAASFGFQAGMQKSSHALFFMTDDAVANFRRQDGWEIGADAEVTFPDKGITAQTNTTLINKPVVAFVFGQDGLLLGASLEGAKYSPIAR